MEIREDEDSVIVDGRVICGLLADDRPCQFCYKTLSVYFDDFDAYACPSCNLWLEEKCGDPGCNRCPNRPASPFGERAIPA